MTYADLLEGIPYSGSLPAGEASAVTQDSRRVVPGCVFVCIEGRGSNGHDYAAAAQAAGAGLILSQQPLGLAHEVTVADTRRAYARLCQRFFGNPAEKLRLVAVTGTNGKTTVTSVLKQLLEQLGHPTGLIGTIRSEIGGMEVPARFTTPEPWDLAALMQRMVQAGCTHAVMEASSQALDQGRLLGLHFEVGVFTNLSRDHLDWHGDMEGYYTAKRSLFGQCSQALINMDDEAGQRMLGEVEGAKFSFSAHSGAADFVAHNVELRGGGVRFGFLGGGVLYPATFPMPGEYSVYNALAAGGAAILLGEAPAEVAAALGRVQGVPGRCEVLHAGRFTVLRDFAHTGDGLDKLLGALKPFVTGRFVVLFGCAGERDAVKRTAMGEAAARWADVVWLTADNPRREPVADTFTHALPPLEASGKELHLVEDRLTAIHEALESLREGDTLALCGKGHEDYQVLDGRTLYLDERQVVEEWLASR